MIRRTLGMLYEVGLRDRNSKGQSCTGDDIDGRMSHQRTIDPDFMLARQFSGLGLNIDGTDWYRLMYIHRHLDLLNLADASVICLSSSVRRNVGPPSFPRSIRVPLLPWRRTKRDLWLPPRMRHGLSSSLICSVSLYRAKFPSLPYPFNLRALR